VGFEMASENLVGFVGTALGLLGVLAVTAGGLLRRYRPLTSLANRLLVFCGVAGALSVVVVILGVVAIAVRGLHVRDDAGPIGDAVIGFFIGAGLGVPAFGVREYLRIGNSEHGP
jgi:hypothetical protein